MVASSTYTKMELVGSSRAGIAWNASYTRTNNASDNRHPSLMPCHNGNFMSLCLCNLVLPG